MNKLYLGPIGMKILSVASFQPQSTRSKISSIASKFNSMEWQILSRDIPDRYTFEKYSNESPKDFKFSFNAPHIFHPITILTGDGFRIKLFFNRMEELGDKAGPIVLTIPDGIEYRKGGVEDILDCLPSHKYVLKPEDDSWFDIDCYEALDKHNVPLAKDYLSPDDAMGDFEYYRIPLGDEARRVNLASHWDHAIHHIANPDRETYLYMDPNDEDLDLAFKIVEANNHRAYNPQSNYKSTSGPDNDPSYYVQHDEDLAFEHNEKNEEEKKFFDDSEKIIDNYPESEPGTHTHSRV